MRRKKPPGQPGSRDHWSLNSMPGTRLCGSCPVLHHFLVVRRRANPFLPSESLARRTRKVSDCYAEAHGEVFPPNDIKPRKDLPATRIPFKRTDFDPTSFAQSVQEQRFSERSSLNSRGCESQQSDCGRRYRSSISTVSRSALLSSPDESQRQLE